MNTLMLDSPRLIEFYNKCHASSNGKFCDTPGGGKTASKTASKAAGAGDTVPSPSKISARALGTTLRKAGYDVASVSKSSSRSWKVKMSDGSTHTISGGSSMSKLPKKSAAAPKAAPKAATKATPTVAAKVAQLKKAVSAKPEAALKPKSEGEEGGRMSIDQMAAHIKKYLKVDAATEFAGIGVLITEAGMNGQPRKVSAAEFAKLDKSEINVRSASPKAHDQLLNGAEHTMTRGADYYGEGTYFANGKLSKAHVEEAYAQKGYKTLEAHIARADVPYQANHLGAIGAAASWINGGKPEVAIKMLKETKGMPKDGLANAYRLAEAVKKSGMAKSWMSYTYNDSTHIALLLGIKAFRIPTPDRQEGLEYISVLDRSIITVVG